VIPREEFALTIRKVGFAGDNAQYFAICFYHDFLNKPIAF